MIQKGNGEKTEAQYREVLLDSSSSLKDFSFDRKKYYKKYYLNEVDVTEEDSKASVMGKIVECLLIEPERFDELFYLSACLNKSTGLMEKFVEAAYQIMRDSAQEDEEGHLFCTKSFSDVSREAYDKSGYKIPYERVIKTFEGSDDEIYFNEILNVGFRNMTVITAQDVTNAENIVNTLRTNFVTSPIINLVNSDRYTVLNQCKIEGFEIDGHLFKSMEDKIIIDHKEKKIKPFDLKVTWSVENFYREYYLFRRAYFQGFIYKKAAEKLKIDMNLEDYSVENLNFIVCDSTDYYNPLIYEMSHKDMKDAYNGFNYNDRYYPGVKETVEDLKWAMEMNIWNISKNNYLSGGVVKLNA